MQTYIWMTNTATDCRLLLLYAPACALEVIATHIKKDLTLTVGVVSTFAPLGACGLTLTYDDLAAEHDGQRRRRALERYGHIPG